MNLKTHHHNNTTKYHLLLILSAKLRLLLQAPLYIITTRLPNSDIQNTTFFQKNVIFYLITVSRPTIRYPKAKKGPVVTAQRMRTVAIFKKPKNSIS